MAAVSAWAKPGSWALASEEHDVSEKTATAAEEDSTDFPSLAAAAVAKVPKKKKAQTLSLAEFNSAPLAPRRQTPPSKVGLTSDEIFALPTGPRERSAEELERTSHRGFGLSYGGSGARRADDSGPRRGFEEPGREQGPSRADEVDDWGAGKKHVLPESRERRSEGSFFDSQSRADESDSWISNKGTATRNDSFDVHRERRMGFGSSGGGGGAEAEFWGKKKVEEPSTGGAGRRRLVLQPRSLALDNTDAGHQNQAEQVKDENKKSKSFNPFGNARPREEVLTDKGEDWKKIDEKLENMKIKEAASSLENAPLGKRTTNGMGSSPEDRTERAWRKPVASEASPPRSQSLICHNGRRTPCIAKILGSITTDVACFLLSCKFDISVCPNFGK